MRARSIRIDGVMVSDEADLTLAEDWPVHPRQVVSSFDAGEAVAVRIVRRLRPWWRRLDLTVHIAWPHDDEPTDIDERVVVNCFLNAGARWVAVRFRRPQRS